MPTEFEALVHEASGRLERAGVASPLSDAWALISHVMGGSRGELQARAIRGDIVVDDTQLAQFFDALARREARQPLWQITGYAPFLDFELEVGPGVFTPRPETELVAHQAITDAAGMVPLDGVLRVVDLCAGSGALGIAVARAVPYASLLAVEISAEAYSYLHKNAERLIPGRYELVHSDVGKWESSWAGSVDLVVSNPPYLLPDEPLDAETAGFDPEIALFGGEDGLEVIVAVIDQARKLLRPGGIVSIEHGVNQGEVIRHALSAAGFRLASTESDLLGRQRYTRATRG